MKDQVTALVTKYGEAISRDELVGKLKFALSNRARALRILRVRLFRADTQHIKELDELRHSHDVFAPCDL